MTFNQEQVVQVFPMFGGRVIAVNAEVGDYVHKGEVLAVVKSGEVAEYEKQLKDAEQQVAVTAVTGMLRKICTMPAWLRPATHCRPVRNW